MKPYTFPDHIHRYAIWTAARAVSRDFTGTENIKQAIEASQLRDFAENRLQVADFDEWHKHQCRTIIETLKGLIPETDSKKKVPKGKEYQPRDMEALVTYGRAAKIIAIYLKTAVVIPGGETDDRCKTIHPPIDRILLHGIADCKKLPHLKNVNWTQLEEADYFALIHELKALNDGPWWLLERYWTP